MQAETLHVLLVEDDPRDASLVRAMLADSALPHISVKTAASLAAALEALRAATPDAVLLDLSLPDARGLDALKTIHEAGIPAPVVVITGMDDEGVALEAVHHGAQDYLVKGKADRDDVRRALLHAIERHRMQQQILEAREREQNMRIEKLESLGVLAGGIAHDFNNLLMGILGNISLARSAPDHQRAELLNEAENAAARATSLTRQLLTFARGGVPIKRVTALSGVLEDAVSFALRGSDVRAQIELAQDLRAVEVDVGQIAQVVGNIVLNADQAMPQGGTIRVCAENAAVTARDGLPLSPGAYVRITFADQGPGIPEEHLTRIFDPYFTTKQKGSGLGLATAFSIVHRHGGTITAVSTLGCGATFSVYLPASSAAAVAEPPAGTPRPARGGRLLVMDDEEAVRRLAKRYLERLHFEVTVAADGAAALEAYRVAMAERRPFGAVIADLTVAGGMGGREFMQRLRAIDPQARAIVSSGYCDDPVMSNPREHGFCGVVPKPYRMAELERVLAEVLEDK
ncbi:MAG: response regulator [Lentisphaerae bacterium]|nr:response regulator [Lentisphaerota bacterium]